MRSFVDLFASGSSVSSCEDSSYATEEVGWHFLQLLLYLLYHATVTHGTEKWQLVVVGFEVQFVAMFINPVELLFCIVHTGLS